MPAFLSLFGFTSKQETAIHPEKDIECDGEVCKPMERKGSVKPTSNQPEIKDSAKKEIAQPEIPEIRSCNDDKENPNIQSSVSHATGTQKPTCVNPPMICRILALLRLKKLYPRCSVINA